MSKMYDDTKWTMTLKKIMFHARAKLPNIKIAYYIQYYLERCITSIYVSQLAKITV